MAEENKMFKVEIICPDRIFYTGEASFMEFTTTSGELGIYKNHIPLTNVLAPGAIKITESNGVKEAAVHAGFVEILQDKVTLLAEIAEWPDEIDVERAKEAEERAKKRLQGKTDEVDLKRAEYALRKALTRIEVASGKK